MPHHHRPRASPHRRMSRRRFRRQTRRETAPQTTGCPPSRPVSGSRWCLALGWCFARHAGLLRRAAGRAGARAGCALVTGATRCLSVRCLGVRCLGVRCLGVRLRLARDGCLGAGPAAPGVAEPGVWPGAGCLGVRCLGVRCSGLGGVVVSGALLVPVGAGAAVCTGGCGTRVVASVGTVTGPRVIPPTITVMVLVPSARRTTWTTGRAASAAPLPAAPPAPAPPFPPPGRGIGSRVLVGAEPRWSPPERRAPVELLGEGRWLSGCRCPGCRCPGCRCQHCSGVVPGSRCWWWSAAGWLWGGGSGVVAGGSRAVVGGSSEVGAGRAMGGAAGGMTGGPALGGSGGELGVPASGAVGEELSGTGAVVMPRGSAALVGVSWWGSASVTVMTAVSRSAVTAPAPMRTRRPGRVVGAGRGLLRVGAAGNPMPVQWRVAVAVAVAVVAVVVLVGALVAAAAGAGRGLVVVLGPGHRSTGLGWFAAREAGGVRGVGRRLGWVTPAPWVRGSLPRSCRVPASGLRVARLGWSGGDSRG